MMAMLQEKRIWITPVIDELRIKFLSRLKLQCSIESEIVSLKLLKQMIRKNTIYHYNLEEKPQRLEILSST